MIRFLSKTDVKAWRGEEGLDAIKAAPRPLPPHSIMDFLKKQFDNVTHSDQQQSEIKQESSGGFMEKVNNALGGGEADRIDLLDKGVDFVQEHFLGQGQQSNESALEQAKDEQISDAIRRGYKSMTGKDFPIADKS